MNSETVKIIPRHIVVFSLEWAKAAALQSMCNSSDEGDVINVQLIDNLHSMNEWLNRSEKNVPDMMVLDINARDYVALLCSVRRKYPTLPVVIAQSRILFSDQVVAGWFGNIWLREYDSLMAGYPDVPLSACVTDPRFSGANTSAICAGACKGQVSDTQVIDLARQWLCERLADSLGSERCARVVTEWLAHGITPREAGDRINRSGKLIYYYRSLVIHSLKISGHPGTFIPSLKLKNGPVSGRREGECRMRIACRNIN
ncbi:hypothetical protein [Citrobacter cronae]|uniref:hypothetical protein n=1 Tax=Citrobacter cronae TaxID=1748967 RepID=UPI0021CE095B|nr:hypothetical protein [Citrobacter cronae]MCU6173006.1 hypothetical protein [Citrobacter cronae]